MEITTSKILTRTCGTTNYNTAKGAHNSGISDFVKLFAEIFNHIFVSNFLLIYCIRNPIQVIKILSPALYSATVNVVKTTVLNMGITIEITTSKILTRTCTTTTYNTANGAPTSGISAFVQLFAQIFNYILLSNLLLFCYIRNITQVITILSGAHHSANVKLVKATVLDIGITINY